MAASGLAHPLLLSTVFHMDQITVAGMTIETKYVFFTWLGMLILLITGLVLRKKLSIVPAGKFQIFFEALVDGLEKFVLNNLGEEKGRRFVPLLASIFIYVLTMNLLGLVPGCDAPTANLNTTIPSRCACSSITTMWASAPGASGTSITSPVPASR